MRHHLNTLNAVNQPVVEFDERLWHVLIDHATINPNGDITFIFKWEVGHGGGSPAGIS